ncbi:putative quinol monooxygenase [Poriferisphaera sp. WC338]|uniref:putative quinol monooxygenase n=1 Tax=Poriferisphaera sp. WC338 TaxID=3425129 RepID=UPI003D816FC8
MSESTLLTIIAKVVAKPGQADVIKPELLKLLEPSRKDPGCLLYDCHQSNEDPCVFLFYETWASKPEWEAHMETPHLKAYRAFTEANDVVADFELLQMQKVEQ